MSSTKDKTRTRKACGPGGLKTVRERANIYSASVPRRSRHLVAVSDFKANAAPLITREPIRSESDSDIGEAYTPNGYST